ncbi:MAG: sensor domain-containing diguanylate cyclase [Pseudomonadota bacterium]
MLDEHKTDEAARKFALDRLDILDTPKEEPFENVVDLIKQVLNVPMCAVSLVDSDRQWFKAERGLGVCETARDISFCTHAIEDTKPFIIPDATKDERFCNSPLVVGDPFIRSYLGIPLKTPDGYVVGSLCAKDKVPREFGVSDVSIMENFANIVTSELELRQIASTDALTGAKSRGAWMEEASSALTELSENGRVVTAAIMDLDHFKSINDTFGHAVGDEVIKELVNVVRSNTRRSDIIGRFGGEEFVLLLPDSGEKEAEIVIERIRNVFAETELPSLKGKKCSVSLGFTLRRKGEVSIDKILERADKALYEAKRNGRNQSVFHN